MNSYKKYFCTFASSNMSKALDRIKRQARDLDFFEGIFIYDENRLDNTFREKFKDKLKSKVRGFGYWVWKPQIILQSLEKIDMGDILLYTDAGCHLNKKGVKKLEEYFEGVNKSELGIGVTQFVIKSKDSALVSESNFEKEWTKGDIFSFFNVLDKEEICNTGQYQGTVLFVKKTEKTLDFIKNELSIFEKNFNLVDDSDSIVENFRGFKENRHDQSLLSILLKTQKENPFIIPASEIYQSNWILLKEYPILAKRDRGLSILNRIRRKFAPYRINKYIRL